jgi:ribosome-binding ATPase YchF (GTP1/OBG family)
MKVFNWQEARSRGLVRLVDRDYTIQEGDVIEIRFNV